MEDIDIAKLKELAERATPGPWEAGPIFGKAYENWGVWDRNHTTAPAITSVQYYSSPHPQQAIDDAAYVAAASPDVVLALIAKNERLEKEADWLAGELRDVVETIIPISKKMHIPIPQDVYTDVSGWRKAARKAVEVKNGYGIGKA